MSEEGTTQRSHEWIFLPEQRGKKPYAKADHNPWPCVLRLQILQENGYGGSKATAVVPVQT